MLVGCLKLKISSLCFLRSAHAAPMLVEHRNQWKLSSTSMAADLAFFTTIGVEKRVQFSQLTNSFPFPFPRSMSEDEDELITKAALQLSRYGMIYDTLLASRLIE